MLRPIPLFPGRGCARRSADLIRRSDFSDVAEVPEEFTENQLRDAHNDIVRRLRPGRVIASALVAILASPLFGGLVVETHAKGSWPNTSNIVTSVSWEGGPGTDTNSVRGVVDSSFSGGTNAVNAAVAAVGSMSNSWNAAAETVGSMSNSWNRAGSDATNYTDSATNALRLCDGAARPLPKYLHAIDFADSYPDAAQEYYRSRGNGKTDGGCSAVRDGGFLYRNFDYPFDDRAEFVVKMSAGPDRFASVGVAQVGTNLTEQIVTSGKPSRCYKWLPGATVDGINENGVVAEINVVDGDPQTSGWHTTGDLHPLGAIRWILDHATNAQHAAAYIAANIHFPQGWTQNFHYMIADATSTYIVENGYCVKAIDIYADIPFRMLNYGVIGFDGPTPIYFPDADEQKSQHPDGSGFERYYILGGANITNAWYTRAYHRSTNPPWVSDLADVIAYTNEIFDAWAVHPKEYFRGKANNGIPWWQSVHTSIYDFAAKTLRVAVQETDDWYTFQVPMSGGLKVETDPTVPAWAKTANPPVTPSSVNPGYAKNADYARSAGTANTATRANSAGTADYAGRADEAAVADEAEFAKYATEATSAGSADNANHAATADNATVASHATTAGDSYAARKVEDSQYPGLSIAPVRNGANGSWVVKDTDHPDGFRLQPTDLSDYFTKAESSTNATAKANEVVSNRVDGLEYLTGGRTAGDTVRAYNELVAKLRGDTLPHGFRLYGATEDFATISNAISFAAAHISGDVRITALEDFRLDGTERWSLLGSRRVVLSGRTADVVLYHTGPASLGFFSNAPRIEGVVSNLTVSATPGMRIADIELASVKWRGWMHGAAVVGSDFGTIRMTNVDVDADGGKYALDISQGSDGMAFAGCTFRGFHKGAVDFCYNRGDATFTGCRFDGSAVNRKDTVGLVNFKCGGGSAVFDRCEFVNLARTVDGVAVNGPAVADRVPDGSPQGTMTFSNCTFGDSVAYVIAYGDPYRDAAHPSNTSTRIHFNLSGDGNWWKNWDGASGTKMTGFGARYTGVGYLGDAPAKGDVTETPWEGSAAQGTFGSLGRRTALAVARAASTVDAGVREPLKPGMVAVPQYAPLSEIEGTRSMLLNADELLRLKQDRRDMTNFYTKAKADAKLAEKIGGGEVPEYERDPTVGLTNGTIHIKGQAITPLTSFTEQDPTATAKANAAIASSPIIANKADRSDIPDVSGFVPYTGATNNLDLGAYHIYCGTVYAMLLDSSYGLDLHEDPVYGERSCNFSFGWVSVAKPGEGYDYYAFPWVYHYDEVDSDSKFAVVSQIEAATNGLISASNPAFADAVKSVAISWDISSVTNAVAALNDFKTAFGDLGAGDIVGGAGTLGGIILALIGAVTWLKKNKVQTLKLNDGSIVKAAENGVVKVDDFFKESNSLLNARITYERNTTGLKDRAFNALTFDGTEYNLSTALAAVTPTASGQPRDLLIVATATAATTISFTAGTIKGDKPTIDGAGTWLITLTEYAANTWYCRQIKMEDAA